ncbi:MAG: hypothetical protein EOP46_21015 [Sphingobacteriaceae bacterium]|nr:MAG: hypothetical protein EOP46_21015 [Sphingobacteriaceae bacterium]
MQKAYFSLKIETRFQFLDADFMVSSMISESEIKAAIEMRLQPLGLRADAATFNYVLKETQLYIEGFAFENVEPESTCAFW